MKCKARLARSRGGTSPDPSFEKEGGIPPLILGEVRRGPFSLYFVIPSASEESFLHFSADKILRCAQDDNTSVISSCARNPFFVYKKHTERILRFARDDNRVPSHHSAILAFLHSNIHITSITPIVSSLSRYHDLVYFCGCVFSSLLLYSRVWI